MNWSGDLPNSPPPGQANWLSVLRRYLVVMALGNLVWEFAHIPLYTLWVTGSTREIVFAALHCTGGDILIAVSTLLAALILFGTGRWPEHGYRRVALAAIVFGLGYAVSASGLTSKSGNPGLTGRRCR